MACREVNCGHPAVCHDAQGCIDCWNREFELNPEHTNWNNVCDFYVGQLRLKGVPKPSDLQVPA